MNIWNSLAAPLRTAWNRITHSRITALYFVLSISYCFIQILFQLTAWNVNDRAAGLFTHILTTGNHSFLKFPILESNGPLRLCLGADATERPYDLCPIVWPTPTPAPLGERIDPLAGYLQVNLDEDFGKLSIPPQCVAVLSWSSNFLANTKREDIVFIAFQIWLLGMSLVALFNESIPHIVASLLTHISACIWSGVHIQTMLSFRSEFTRTTINGACRGLDLLPGYFKPRTDALIGTTVINGVSLLASAYLTWILVGTFGWNTFKKIGASIVINRIYKLALTLWISIQLTLFFLVGLIAVWIDQLYSGIIGYQAVHSKIYKFLFILVLVLLPPWLATGWFGVRKEGRKLMIAFHALSILFLVGCGTMLRSQTFRITFLHWPFFSMMVLVSFSLVLATVVFGVICRFNFGKGLPEYIARSRESEKDDLTFIPSPDVVPDDVEKVMFPVTFDSDHKDESSARSEKTASAYDRFSLQSMDFAPMQRAASTRTAETHDPAWSSSQLTRGDTTTSTSTGQTKSTQQTIDTFLQGAPTIDTFLQRAPTIDTFLQRAPTIDTFIQRPSTDGQAAGGGGNPNRTPSNRSRKWVIE